MPARAWVLSRQSRLAAHWGGEWAQPECNGATCTQTSRQNLSPASARAMLFIWSDCKQLHACGCRLSAVRPWITGGSAG